MPTIYVTKDHHKRLKMEAAGRGQAMFETVESILEKALPPMLPGAKPARQPRRTGGWK
ncbi:MAG TPA: hypothetical protein VMQ76_13265 [Terracidiphilus sp.]|nr:hypothetical protein [Terracidiphilus sp.]